MKAFLVFRWTLAALAAVNLGPREEVMEIDAGSEAIIPCKLTKTKTWRKWHWVPLYPICAGMKEGPTEMVMFSSGTSTEKLVFLVRFQQRLTEHKQPTNSSTVFLLTIQTTYMNDSGTFFCSNAWESSSKVLVIVKPGYQNGITTRLSKELHRSGQSVNIFCNHCEHDGSSQAHDTITWTLNGNPLPNRPDIKVLRNNIIIGSFSSRYYGLWNCSRSMCPGKFEGYCLESYETASSSTPTPPNAGTAVDARLIGACVAALLGFLLVGAVIFFICRRRQSHSVSETMREPDIQEGKNPTGSPTKRDKEEHMPDDHVPKEQAEGIQYSALKFRDPGGHQIKTDYETSAVIYSDIIAAHD